MRGYGSIIAATSHVRALALDSFRAFLAFHVHVHVHEFLLASIQGTDNWANKPARAASTASIEDSYIGKDFVRPKGPNGKGNFD
jgi:hypothetical protein